MSASRQRRRGLARLYAQIPTFECEPGCTDCCGPVPASDTELTRAPLLADIVERLERGCLDCPYSLGGNCSVYADRPFICRLFGTAPEDERLRCPKGRAPTRPLTAAQAAALTNQYFSITGMSQ